MLKRFLFEKWSELIGEPLPSSIDLALLTSCTKDYGNNIVLVFTDKGKEPNYVIKISRNPAFSFKLRREYVALNALCNFKKLNPFIPTPFFIGEYNGCTFFIQSGVSGHSLFKSLRKSGLNKTNHLLVEQAIDLLADINSSTGGIDNGNVLWPTKTKDVLKGFESEFINAGVNRSKIAELINFSEYMEKNCSRLLFIHGDYWPTNIIVNDRKKKINGVIDWEFSCPGRSLPFDIMWFLINLAFSLYGKIKPGATLFDSFKWGFFESGKHNEAFTLYYNRYLYRTGVEYKLLNLLLEISLAEMATRELVTYGRHSHMDEACLEMLKYTIQNEGELCIG